jgi:hypothetical protein
MFAMELGARGGSGDETVAIPTMELDSIKPPRTVEKPEPDSTAQTEARNTVHVHVNLPSRQDAQPQVWLGTRCREIGSKVQIPSETGTREVGALLYLTHTNSDRHPHLTRHDWSPEVAGSREEERRRAYL